MGEPSKKLKVPAREGAVEIMDAGFQLTETMEDIADSLASIDRSLAIISTYALRKGREDGVFAPDEFNDEPEEEEQGAGD